MNVAGQNWRAHHHECGGDKLSDGSVIIAADVVRLHTVDRSIGRVRLGSNHTASQEQPLLAAAVCEVGCWTCPDGLRW